MNFRNDGDFLDGHTPEATYTDGLPSISLPLFSELLQEGCNNPKKKSHNCLLLVWCKRYSKIDRCWLSRSLYVMGKEEVNGSMQGINR